MVSAAATFFRIRVNEGGRSGRGEPLLAGCPYFFKFRRQRALDSSNAPAIDFRTSLTNNFKYKRRREKITESKRKEETKNKATTEMRKISTGGECPCGPYRRLHRLAHQPGGGCLLAQSANWPQRGRADTSSQIQNRSIVDLYQIECAGTNRQSSSGTNTPYRNAFVSTRTERWRK